MYNVPSSLVSHRNRLSKLAKKFSDKEYRDSYLASHIKNFLAGQIRALRLREDMSQADFGKLLGKPQSVVSRLEDPDYGKATLQTLLDVAKKLNVGLVVRFVDFPTFLRMTEDLSDASLIPKLYNQADMDTFAGNIGFTGNHFNQTSPKPIMMEQRQDRASLTSFNPASLKGVSDFPSMGSIQ